jgi:hypothetical protein
MSKVSNISIQFGKATLDSSGVGPILVDIEGSKADNTSIVLTPEKNVDMSVYTVDHPLYAISSTESASVDFNYLIVSST